MGFTTNLGRAPDLKLGPRWPSCCHLGPSCCHLGPSWARLCASWRQLGWIFRNFVATSVEGWTKMSPEPLRTFIFCIFGASGRRFSSLSALRFLGFRLCCPSSVHASIFLSHTFCTYSLRVFPNTAGHQIVLRRLLREACSIYIFYLYVSFIMHYMFCFIYGIS